MDTGEDLYLGLISGTSADGIDAALVQFDASGERLHATLRFGRTYPWPEALRRQLVALGQQAAMLTLDDIATLDVRIGEQFAQVALRALADAGVDPAAVRAIGSHGQTLRHGATRQPPFTLQLGDANVIAERTGITTVADFRRRDIAAGGQGAPLVPAFHAAMFRHPQHTRVILNLGGIANITVLPQDITQTVTGFDTGPANVLLDGWTARHCGTAYDAGGRWAGGGTVLPALLERLLADAYFTQAPPKSTGREHFNLEWLEAQLVGTEDPQDVQATLLELTARSVAQAVAGHAESAEEVLVCGGGAGNDILMQRLAFHLAPRAVHSSAIYGVEPQAVEAMAFAWLARQTLHGAPGNLPAVTGARHPVVLGGIYPGRLSADR